MGRTISFVANTGEHGPVWAIGPEEHALLQTSPGITALPRRRNDGSYTFHSLPLPLFDVAVPALTPADRELPNS